MDQVKFVVDSSQKICMVYTKIFLKVYGFPQAEQQVLWTTSVFLKVNYSRKSIKMCQIRTKGIEKVFLLEK